MRTVHLEHAVAGDGPTVVLVHGHPFDRTMWAPQLPALTPRYRVVTPDLRGYGSSPATRGCVTMAELAADVWALLDDVGASEIAVAGLSMGGLVAMEMLIARPQQVWALALLATTAEPVTDAERTMRLELADAAERHGMAPLVEAMAPHLFGPHADVEVIARVHAMMAGNNPAGAAAALRGRAERPDYRESLRALNIPSFVCVGTRDHWSTARVTEQLVACLHAPRTLTLPDVGHLPNLEEPAAVNAALLDFLAEAAEGETADTLVV